MRLILSRAMLLLALVNMAGLSSFAKAADLNQDTTKVTKACCDEGCPCAEGGECTCENCGCSQGGTCGQGGCSGGTCAPGQGCGCSGGTCTPGQGGCGCGGCKPDQE